ncbi:hypothetical protein J1N35_044912 [Gossypium stocksii]|uniref:CCT domain-containing protein n=1 Tax=Gossypium stocksii TaxID=47602 RepID=A0A9D3ZGV9_9ROSI|nr:hypothetical protein J1N35_044912 [Gossypium stocksii]
MRQYLFFKMDLYLDLDYRRVDPKMETQDQEQNNFGTNGVIPIQINIVQALMVADHCFNMAFTSPKAFPYYYNYNPYCLSHNVSKYHHLFRCLGGSTMTNISVPCMKVTKTTHQTVQPSWTDREERLVRYKEKRNTIKFEKTIHYASRKAYAKVRLRIEGRFAKSSDVEVEVDGDNMYGFRKKIPFMF